MGVLYQSPDLALPWSSSRREDRRFNILVLIFVVFVFVAGIWLQNVTLPEKSQKELEKLPPQLAKVILKKKEEPKPPPPPKPKVEEKKPEEKKPEPKKEEEKPKPKPKPKTEEVQKAREKAKKTGLLAMQDDLAAMRQAFTPQASQKLSKDGAKAAEVKRSVIMGKATATSGGIKTAALPATSGVGGLSGREVTQVDSVSLGGAVVDGSGGVAEAASSGGVSGSRSEELIRAVLDQNKGALYAIYNRALRKDPTLQGKVTFELVIEADGSVSACKVISSELGNAGLETKLVARMKLIDFGAEDVSVTKTRWAIDFLPY